MICQKREPRPKQEKSGVPGNPHGGWFCEDSIEETRWRGRYFLRNVWHEQPVGMRSWKCRITPASFPGIEIASASPAAVLKTR